METESLRGVVQEAQGCACVLGLPGGSLGDQTGVSSSASGLGLLRTAPHSSYVGWKWGKGRGFKVAHRVSV